MRQTIRILCFNVIYFVLLTILSPWILWRFLIQKKNRRGWQAKLFGQVPVRQSRHDDSANCIWLHAVSVGEVNLLVPIIEELSTRHPEAELVVSTTTETGYDLARQKFSDRCVFFFPSDFSWAVNRAICRISPDMIVLAELEVWPNFVQLASRHEISIVVFNGRLSQSSARGYQRLKWLLQPTFAQLDLVCAQDQTYAQRFVEVGCAAANVHVTGNLKFDGAQTNKRDPSFKLVQALAKQIGLTESQHVFIAGSTQIEDEIAAVSAFLSLRESYPALRLVIVPRHPSRTQEIVDLLRSYELAAILRSQLTNTSADSTSDLTTSKLIHDSSDVFVVDVIGELSAWWSLGDCAFVGGSMGKRGGQNMLEPAALGVPVCFGPNTKNFRTVVEQLLDRGAAKRVHDSNELAEFLDLTITDSAVAQQMGANALQFISESTGAAAKTADLIDGLLAKITKNLKAKQGKQGNHDLVDEIQAHSRDPNCGTAASTRKPAA